MTASESLLLDYQSKWLADRSPVKVCEKSRRIGLSWGDACDSTLTAAATKEAGGMDCWYIGYNKDMAQEYIRDCADWAKSFNAAAEYIGEEVLHDEDKDILTFVIKFASGYRITALSSRPSNLRGKQGKVTIDEAAFHEKLGELLKAAMALLIWGGRVCIISTHNGEANEFNDLVQEIRAGKKDYSLHRIPFMDAIAAGLYKRICKVTGKAWTVEAEAEWIRQMYAFYGDNAAEELDVIPSSGSGVYLTRAAIEGIMSAEIPVLRWRQPDSFAQLPKHIREAECLDWCERELLPLLKKLPANLRHYLGSDFARSGDISALWPLIELQALQKVTPFIIELRNIPFEQQRQILFYLLDRLPRFSGAAMDARGNGQYLAEVAMQRYGSTLIAQVMLSQDWYREHMPPFKAAIEDRTVNAPKDADVMTDLRSIKSERGVAKVPDSARTRGSDGSMRHGDTAIALVLAIFATRMIEAVPMEFQSAGARQTYQQQDQYRGPDFFNNNQDSDRGFGTISGGNDFNGYII